MEFMKTGPRVSALEAMMSWRSGSVTISVLTPVGWMVLTRMLCSASSLAIQVATPTTPCLAAV